MSTNSGSLFSIILLFKIIAWCITVVFILPKVCLMALMIFIKKMCVVALAPTIMTISDSTFYPLLVIFSLND